MGVKQLLILSILVCMILTLLMPGCGQPPTEPTPPTPIVTPTAPQTLQPFYGVNPALESKLERIVLADAGVQQLIEDKDQTFTVQGQTITDKDYHLAVGVRLRENITKEQFREWQSGGRNQSDLIAEYVGVLNVGYNAKFDVIIDPVKEEVSEIVPQAKPGPGIPDITAEEKQRAVEIALNDPTVQQILEGKNYEIAPEGRIGVWHSGQTKLGVSFEIRFDKAYTVDIGGVPSYKMNPYHLKGEIKGLIISVHLAEGQVASIKSIGPSVK